MAHWDIHLTNVAGCATQGYAVAGLRSGEPCRYIRVSILVVGRFAQGEDVERGGRR